MLNVIAITIQLCLVIEDIIVTIVVVHALILVGLIAIPYYFNNSSKGNRLLKNICFMTHASYFQRII